MSSSKKTILFTSVASIILLIITYLITVNIETGAISVDSPWISNNFFFAFFGEVLFSKNFNREIPFLSSLFLIYAVI